MSHDLWRTNRDGQLSAEADGFRLTVQNYTHGARYVVLRKLRGEESQPFMVIGSGTEATVRNAMKAAVRSATRLMAALKPITLEPADMAD